MSQLPISYEVPVNSLAGLFEKTTNSYKYLFFLALIELIEKDNFRTRTIHLEEIFIEMAAISWYPLNHFQLSFGSQDQIALAVSRLKVPLLRDWIGSPTNQRCIRKELRRQYQKIGLRKILGRFVQFRLLSPFFKNEIAGIRDDHKRNIAILNLANCSETKSIPLYTFEGNSPNDVNSITIHPAWLAYLKLNSTIVKGWVERHWIDYLQRRNPSTPAVSEKLNVPKKRKAMRIQLSFWREFINETAYSCIYSGKTLSPDALSLDHFIPWSFVCHDRNWNLTPVTIDVNIQKSNSLPDESRYLGRLVDIHYEVIKYLKSKPCSKRAKHFLDEYESDLQIKITDAIDRCHIFDAYEATVVPLLSLARRAGFNSGWSYQDTV